MITGNKTHNQLYWDKQFVEKRIKEQLSYIESIPAIKRYYSRSQSYRPKHDYTPRNQELANSAEAVLARFERQLENIKKLK